MYIELSQHNTRNHSSFGQCYTIVKCVAAIVQNSITENYDVEYYRDPISGEVRNVTCAPKAENETTENTLTPKAVEDLVWDKLQQ